MNLFASLYTAVAVLFYLLAFPLLLLLIFKQKYTRSLPARFFLWQNPPLQKDGIWIHSCSFGEARSLRPLYKIIPPTLLRLTTTTQTGMQEIEKQTEQSRYLPYELLLYFWIKPQKMVIVMEAELWYLLFLIARRKGARTLWVNARMSERSYPRYMRFGWLYRKIFEQIDGIYAQSSEDKERLEGLGAQRVVVMGNIKFADIAKPTKNIQKPSGILVCAGSTHEGEEAPILAAFRMLKQNQPDAKLIIVPRHPERFEKVNTLISGYAYLQGWSYQRYTIEENLQSDIILIDTMGELINFYAISDIVILGGAFEPIGGHNAAEAAQFGCKIISGEHYFNQKDIFAGIEGITIATKESLAEILQYPKLLAPSKIKKEIDLSPLISEIQNVL